MGIAVSPVAAVGTAYLDIRKNNYGRQRQDQQKKQKKRSNLPYQSTHKQEYVSGVGYLA